MASLRRLVALFFLCRVFALSFNFSPLGKNVVGIHNISNVTRTKDNFYLNDYFYGGAGKIYYEKPFHFKDSTNVASFNTSFTFEITYGDDSPCDGMAFFVQADPTPIAVGGRLGQNGTDDNPFLAVEFDTYQNKPDAGENYWSDPPGCHVGIDLNSLISVTHRSANITNKRQRACIDYDARTEMLVLRLANDTSTCPSEPLISSPVNFTDFFKNNDYLYVGLSASAFGGFGGFSIQEHIVYSWSFSITEINHPSSANSSTEGNHLSSTNSSRNLRVIILAVVIPGLVFICGILVCALCYKRTRKYCLPQMSQFELPQMPLSRFSYADISNATRGFSQGELLGKGGFGSVYKGILPSDGSTVAVKVMSAEGYHQFMAELSVIGRLKHKNLVGLRGWSYHIDKLIYDYMPNGSLDQHIFSQDKLLSWSQRYDIIKGAAEGLAFLHGGWEQRIVHRDIKAANVLLDSNFMARLGDFGLSKLMENNRTQQTMTQAGTRGYIAPELAYIGRASEKSDIYSFGILMLEVACGRPVLVVNPESQEFDFLLEWVWEAQALDALFKVADPRLGLEYDEDQMRLVLCLGLLCSHPDADQRPSIRRCCQILNAEAIPPSLPNSKPMFFGFFLPSVSSNSASALLSESTVRSSV